MQFGGLCLSLDSFVFFHDFDLLIKKKDIIMSDNKHEESIEIFSKH